MEQRIADRNVEQAALLQPAKGQFTQNKNNPSEKQRKDFIYISTQACCLELMEATGGSPITMDNLIALNYRGYLDYSPVDIFSSNFDDVDDLNTDVRLAYDSANSQKELQRQQLAVEIEAAELPPELFKPLEFVAIEGVSPTKTNKDGTTYLIKDLGLIRDGGITEDERLTRYTKYMLAKKLLAEVRTDISEKRLLGIAMGIFLDDKNPSTGGRKISSYQSEIYKASNLEVDQADVEIAAEAAGWYELIYPDRRSDHLLALKKASEAPVIVPWKNKEEAYRVLTSEVSMDTARKRLLLGETAVKAVLEKGSKPESIHKIGKLLLQNVQFNFADSKNHYTFRDWTDEDFLSYGKWLLSAIDNDPENYDVRLIDRAYALGLGPSVKSIQHRFGTMREFYKSIDIKRRRAGWFTHWTFDKAIEHLQMIAASNGGRTTKDMIRARIEEGSDEPSPKVYEQRWGFNNVLKAAGLPIYNHPSSKETCLQAGIAHFRQHGELPKKSDFTDSEELPSEYTIRKYCGGIKAFQKLILEQLDIEATVAA